MKEYKYTVNDRPTLTFTIRRSGTAVDLTTYGSARFKMGLNSTSVLKASGLCTTLAADGTCVYAVGSSDFNAVGMYFARIMLTTGTKNEHSDRFRIVVERI